MQSDQVIVRAAEDSDVPRIARSYEWLFAPPGTRPLGWDEHSAVERLRRAIAGEESAILVAESGKDLVGFCSIYLDIESVRYGRRAWVEDLAVHPNYRSRGIGKRLLGEAKSWARSRDATHLKLDSGVARIDAHRFYERERPTGRSNCYGWRLDEHGH